MPGRRAFLHGSLPRFTVREMAVHLGAPSEPPGDATTGGTSLAQSNARETGAGSAECCPSGVTDSN